MKKQRLAKVIAIATMITTMANTGGIIISHAQTNGSNHGFNSTPPSNYVISNTYAEPPAPIKVVNNPALGQTASKPTAITQPITSGKLPISKVVTVTNAPVSTKSITTTPVNTVPVNTTTIQPGKPMLSSSTGGSTPITNVPAQGASQTISAINNQNSNQETLQNANGGTSSSSKASPLVESHKSLQFTLNRKNGTYVDLGMPIGKGGVVLYEEEHDALYEMALQSGGQVVEGSNRFLVTIDGRVIVVPHTSGLVTVQSIAKLLNGLPANIAIKNSQFE